MKKHVKNKEKPTLRHSGLASQGLLVGKVEHQVGKGLAVLAQLPLLSLRVVQVGPQPVLLIEVWGGGPARRLAIPP